MSIRPGANTGRRICLASGNAGKLRELSSLLTEAGIELVSQRDLDVPEADENGLTFVENAIIKARNAAARTGLGAIADDSGIEVDALAGAPGIRSSRFAGPGADDRANVERLLAALEGVPEERRTARFRCVIVYMRHDADPTPDICQGTWEGRILLEPRGTHGFGYDPVFLVPGHGCAAAELDPAVKNRISHRGQALRCLKERLASHAGAAAADHG